MLYLLNPWNSECCIFLNLSVHIWIMSQFLANAGSLTVAWQHLCFIRQHAEMAQAVDDAEHAAAREIGSADGALEEGVAREEYVLCLAIEAYRAVAVARSLDDGEFVVAELDYLIFLKEMTDRREVGVELHLVECLCLMSQTLHQLLIALCHFRLQSELLVDGIVAEIMVEMTMGNEEMNRLQIVLSDILGNRLALFWIEGTAIYDDALEGVIADHVAVFLQHVDLESFDM